MCSGKSTVGRQLADLLSWDFVDFDEQIESSQEKTIADIFREHGEAYFRLLEAQMTEAIEDQRSVVLAPGGGWVTQRELVDRLRPDSLTIWLRVQPETVYLRHDRQVDVDRPLLPVEQPVEAIRSILDDRTPLYRQADGVVDTDGREPAEVAQQIAEIVASFEDA
jgi:shikimate kinase